LEALQAKLAREAKKRAAAEKESKKAKKQVDELREMTRNIVSDTEDLLHEQKQLEGLFSFVCVWLFGLVWFGLFVVIDIDMIVQRSKQTLNICSNESIN
jgi:hypothetical protein